MIRCFLLFICVLYLSFVQAQVDQKPLSWADSMYLKRMLDSLNHQPLLSQRKLHYWDSVLTIKPYRAYWWQQKSMPLYKMRKLDLALICLDSAAKYDRMRYYPYRAYSKIIFHKTYQEALNEMNQCLLEYGNRVEMDHDYVYWKGLCFLQLNQLDSAAACFIFSKNQEKQNIKSNTVHYMTHFYLGITYMEQEKYDKAIQELNLSLERYPRFADAHYYKANCLVELGKKEEAYQCILLADTNFKAGYSINEDEFYYDLYPYQINQRFHIDNLKKWLENK